MRLWTRETGDPVVLPISRLPFPPVRESRHDAEKGSLGSYPQCPTVVKRTHRAVQMLAAIFSLVLGVMMVYHIGFLDGLFA